MARDDKLDALAATGLFSGCSDKQLAAIGGVTERATLKAGHTLIHEGHTAYHMAIVISGEGEVLVDGTKVADVKAGDVVGELGLIDGEKASATVSATSDMDCWLVARAGFMPIYEANAELARPLLNHVIAKLRATDKLLH